MSWLKTSRTSRARGAAQAGGTDLPSPLRVLWTALDLRRMVEEVTIDEFHRQEDLYEHDCSQGRELLFLIANQEWVRGTSEVVTIARSDTIETEIKIDIDLRQITHEAFREKIGLLWLPVGVLPLLSVRRSLEPDPFATVTDAAGSLLPLMPADDLVNSMSAALAEIIVNMAIAHVPDLSGTTHHDVPDEGQARDQYTPDRGQALSLRVASREQRILLAAAVCRLLRRGSGQHTGSPASASAAGGIPCAEEVSRAFEEFLVKAKEVRRDTRSAFSKIRITRTRNLLLRLIDSYVEPLGQSAGLKEAPTEEEYLFVPELAGRAMKVLQALASSTIIVVPVDFDVAPTVLTVRIPPRNLKPVGQRFTWRRPLGLLNFHQWLIRPSGHLEIDVLLPMADAARQIQVHLADGMSFEDAKDKDKERDSQHILPRLEIEVERPAPLHDLSTARAEVAKAAELGWSGDRSQPLTNLAQAKAAVVDDLMRHYDIRSGPDTASIPPGSHAEGRKPLSELLAGDYCLFQRTSVDQRGPRTLVARVVMIEDVTHQATPKQATVQADVRVDDRDYFSAARTSAIMSMIVMAIILGSIAGWHYFAHTSSLSPEVAAIVLTLFVTIQASRIGRPDRTTLKGLLSAAGALLIAPSVLPSLTLAVALSFGPGVLGATLWAAGCIAGQALLLGFMWRGPLTAIKAPSYQPPGSFSLGERRHFETEHLDYSHFEAMRSDYCRNTTAEALKLGRMAYGYVIWQGDAQPRGAVKPVPPQLQPLLARGEGPAPIADKPTSVLALLHSSTRRQAMTFVVLRDKLKDCQVEGDHGESELPKPSAPIMVRLDLDPDRLAPMDNVTSRVDVFIGLHGDFPTLFNHPLKAILAAARKKLIVLEAQLPFPPPIARYNDKQWARVRVALRDSGDIRRLTEFLKMVYEEFEKPEHSAHVLAVQTDPTAPLAVIFGGRKSPDAGGGNTPAAGTGDLHVPAMDEPSEVTTWRMLVACAEARSNIESDIITQRLSAVADFQLVHLNFAVMHGMAVIIVLLHKLDAPGHEDGRAYYTRDQKGTMIRGEISQDQLGPMVPCPLMRIRFRWQDRPGAFLSVLNSINSTLEQKPPAILQKDRSLSYARVQIATGRRAEGDLTVRLHREARGGKDWTPAEMERMARAISADAALEVMGRRDALVGTDYPERPENPVIRIDLLGQ